MLQHGRRAIEHGSDGILPLPHYCYASLLRSSPTISHGMLLHSILVQHHLHHLPLLHNLLLQMYGSSGALLDTFAVFAAPHPASHDRFAWNFVIRSFATHGSPSAALALYKQMMFEGVVPDRFILVAVLSACQIHQRLDEGRRLHSCIQGTELEVDTVVGTAFLNMYSNCDSVEDARILFDKLREQDVVAFNATIAAFQQSGRSTDALQLFDQMHQQAMIPEKVTFLNVLAGLTCEESASFGKRFHVCCFSIGLTDHSSIGTALMSMYGKCGSVDAAEKTFKEITQHDLISWNAMISICAEHGYVEKAIHLIEEMRQGPVMPDSITVIGVLNACVKQGLVLDETWIETNITKTKRGIDVELGVSVINMYAKSGNLDQALETFRSLPNRNIASWNAIISAFASNMKLDIALELTEAMFDDGISPNRHIYVCLLSACGHHVALGIGRRLHACIIESDLELDPTISTSIIEMNNKCGALVDAQVIFRNLNECTVIGWNALISGCIWNSHVAEALQIHQQMLNESVLPSDVTFLCILEACASTSAFALGTWIHGCILGMKIKSSSILNTVLLSMYGKCGNLSYAQILFDELPVKDIVSWSAIISAHILAGWTYHALDLFRRIQEEGLIPDKVSYASILSAFIGQDMLLQAKKMHACLEGINDELDATVEIAVICMYCKCNSFMDAFTFLNKRNRTVSSWNSVMSELIQNGKGRQAFQLFDQMQQEGILPNNSIYASILDACCDQVALSKGHRIHAAMVSSAVLFDQKVQTSLLYMYANCGNVDDAEREFHKMPMQDIESWTAIITANAQHGHGRIALRLFQEMLGQGLEPNESTFASIISACSHAGLVDEVKMFVNCVIHAAAGTHLFNCTIDLLARAGKLDEAEALIAEMPYDPTIVSWTTLLGACRSQVDVRRGERIADQLFRLDAHNPEPYVALSNLYAAARMENELFNEMSCTTPLH